MQIISPIGPSDIARSLALFFALSVLGAMFVGLVWFMVFRLTPEHRRRGALRWLLVWSARGLILPFILWAVINLGISWDLQPYMPEVQAAQMSTDPWIPTYLGVLGMGAYIVATYWAAITLGWVIVRASIGLEGEARSDFRALSATCSLAMLIPAAVIVWLGGLPSVGLAAGVILGPIVGAAPGVLKPKRLLPMYSRAIARIKFGKYSEAELEIIGQLEKCEDDFDGWMMLADLYASKFSDLAEAEQTILEVCDHAKTTPSQLSVALHKLADWHLNLADDPEAARRALNIICDRLRGTHLAMMAQLRIKQLPATAEALREQRTNKPIALPPHAEVTSEVQHAENISVSNPDSWNIGEPIGSASTTPSRFPSSAGGMKEGVRKPMRVSLPSQPAAKRAPVLDPVQAAQQANVCVEKLRLDPNDIASREELAHLLADGLGHVERGLEQINLLLNMPGQSHSKRAEWLALATAWQRRQTS